MNPHFELPSETWQVEAGRVLEQAQVMLWQHEPVLDYLHTVRGLSSAAIEMHGLGYLPAERGGHRFGDYWLPGGIVIPWYRERRLVQLRVRCQVGNFAQHLHLPEDRNPAGMPRDKYMTMSGGKALYHLWGVDDLKASGFVLVTEGEFDAMLTIQHLCDFEDNLSVVTIGAANNRFDDSFIEQVSSGRYWVLIATDRDPAGTTNGKVLAESLMEHDPAIKHYHQRLRRAADMPGDPAILYLLRQSLDITHFAQQVAVPEGKDITDFVIAGGNLAAWYKEQRGLRFWLIYDLTDQHYEFYRLMSSKTARLKSAQRELVQHRVTLPVVYGPALLSVVAEADGWLEQYKQGWATIKDYARIDRVVDEWLDVAVFALVERLEQCPS